MMIERLKSPVELEEEVLAFWERERVFHRSLEARAGAPEYVFYEGPPTANGTPHNGHVLTRVVKDVFPRFQTMRGFRVDRKAGWDTHGLPVEVEVEKALDIHGREAIEAYGLEAFSRRCVESVFTYVREWEDLTKQIGFWVDLPEAYVTFHRSYVESVWWALARLHKKGLLYQGHKVVWWWPQGGTTLSAGEVGMGYRTVEDPAVTVRFRDASNPRLSYLAWTTTPWTLPSNVGLAVGETITYAVCDDPHEDGSEVVVAEALAESFGLVPKRTLTGAELVGRRYQPLYDFGPVQGGDSFVIVIGHHVTTSAGTGIVHTAPAFGEDDMLVAKKTGLGLLQWIEPSGRFPAEAGFVAGLFCKDADKPIIGDLKARGLLFKRDTVRHDYPFCWRADSDPLIQYARPAWFIRTTQFVDEALRNNGGVKWFPEHIQEGRFGDFLRNNVDWALSRERFWGTPLPIWNCEACEHSEAAESVAALRARGATGFADGVDEHLQVHRPWVDQIVMPCPHCGGTMRRVPEVIDCWFDSGAMPFAQWGFPHQGVEQFRRAFPADFISEAIDQTRGWFYSLLMISTMLFDDETCQEYGLKPVGLPRPFKSCIVLGHVCDMEGRKESKSKGNYTSPNLVLRGRTRLQARPDAAVQPGEVGLMKDQANSLDLARNEKITLYAQPGGPTVAASVAVAKVTAKDTVHLNPADLAALGLPEAGGEAWFQMPNEAPGADAFRWLFCSASPPWTNTRLSLRAIRDGQREFLMRLRNVVQFFTIYANIAEEQGRFSPNGAAPRGPQARGELDRWILHQLHTTIGAVTDRMVEFGLYEACKAITTFVDDLSNWYVRRSRARFWGEGDDTVDALWTLYEVLTTLSRLIAPFVPFTAEAMHQALVRGPIGEAAPFSVHIADWPVADPAQLDPKLAADMALARELASLGLSARTASKVKVRQPLEAVTIVLADPSREAAVRHLAELLHEELNVRELRFAARAGDFVNFQVKPDFKKLGRTLGGDMKRCAAAMAALAPSEMKAALDAGGLVLDLGDRQITLTSEEVQVTVEAQAGFQAASSPMAVVALHTELTDDLRAEGFVRELVNRVQGIRKELNLGYTERVQLNVEASAEVSAKIERFVAYLKHETLTTAVGYGAAPPGAAFEGEVDVDGEAVRLAMHRA